jgi:hypothetical protein
MGATLIQQRRVSDDAALQCKALLRGKNLRVLPALTVPLEEAPANSVPAASVIRGVQALSGFIGRKGLVGGTASQA